jgi:Type VI secretion system/phage-baseplate injector OB domain
MLNHTEEVLARLIERVESRFFGKYRGQVTDNNDPNSLDRVKAKVPRVLGDEESGWALPAFIYGGASEQGLFAVPDIGAGIWMEFEGGDLSYPVWTGTWYTGGAIPESAQPGKKVLKTKSGHKIVLDDDGHSVEITDSNSNSITMNSGTIKIAAGSATTIVIDAPQIQLVESSTHPLVFGDQLLQYLNQIVQMYQTHVHPGELAQGVFPVTPAPPVPPLLPPLPSMLSMKVTTG